VDGVLEARGDSLEEVVGDAIGAWGFAFREVVDTPEEGGAVCDAGEECGGRVAGLGEGVHAVGCVRSAPGVFLIGFGDVVLPCSGAVDG
jgi:hypothetical protein